MESNAILTATPTFLIMLDSFSALSNVAYLTSVDYRIKDGGLKAEVGLMQGLRRPCCD
jgi:hypothetical protein